MQLTGALSLGTPPRGRRKDIAHRLLAFTRLERYGNNFHRTRLLKGGTVRSSSIFSFSKIGRHFER